MGRRGGKSPVHRPSVTAYTGQSRNLPSGNPVVPARQIAPARGASAKLYNHPFKHAQRQRARQVRRHFDVRPGLNRAKPVSRPIERRICLRQMPGTGGKSRRIKPGRSREPGAHPHALEPRITI